MINKKIIYISVIFLTVVIASFIFVSSQDIYSIKLIKGKNNIRFNITEPFYVKTLIETNPNIEVVSYNDYNKSIGYINIFSGVGDNFIIDPSKDYEIIVKEDTNLILPHEKSKN